MVAISDDLSDEERQGKLLSLLMEAFAHSGEPTAGPKDVHRKHGLATPSFITPPPNNANPSLLVRTPLPMAESLNHEVDIGLLHSFACLMLSRLGTSAKGAIQLRILMCDRDFEAVRIQIAGHVLTLILDEYKNGINISAAKAGGFTEGLMETIKKAFPASGVSHIERGEATEEKLAFRQ